MIGGNTTQPQLTIPSYSPQTTQFSMSISAAASAYGTSGSRTSLPSRLTGPVFLAQRSPGGLNERPKLSCVVTPRPPTKMVIIEPAEDKFRYRYKSEMSGTHGCIHGKNRDKKKKSFPTVKVDNVEDGLDKIIMRVGLYSKPNKFSHHVHKLMMKGVSEKENEQDFIELETTRDKNFVVEWKGLGIIHTSKSNTLKTLQTRKKKIALEMKRMKENDSTITLKNYEEQEQEEAAKKVKDDKELCPNMNTSYLGWEAFKVERDIYFPLCEMIFSDPINNLKNPSTGDLKITRISKGCGSVCGGEEIFVFTERVIKGNIKIRFFQEKEDDPEERVWEEFAKFGETDVHHQYAIAFTTPAYKDLSVIDNIEVYFELFRPSDQAISEKKPFRYTPAPQHSATKRRRYYTTELNQTANNEFRELEHAPTPIQLPSFHQMDYSPREYKPHQQSVSPHHQPVSPHQQQHQQPVSPHQQPVSPKQQPVSPHQQEIQILDNNSLEVAVHQLLQDTFKGTAMDTNVSHTTTSYTDLSFAHAAIPVQGTIYADGEAPARKANDSVIAVNLMPKTLDDIVVRIRDYEIHFRENPTSRETRDKIIHFLGYTTSDGDNLLHTGVLNGDADVLKYLLRAIVTFNCKGFIDERNKEGDTPLHLAIKIPNSSMSKLLLEAGANPNMKNLEGNSAVHLALLQSNSVILTQLLNNTFRINPHLNIANNDGLYPFHLAVKTGKLEIVMIMKEQGCDFNIRDRMRGSTPLHLSLELGHVHITRYLVLKAMVNPTVENFGGQSGMGLAQELGLTHLLEPALPENRICNPENDKILTEWVTEKLSNEDIRLDDFLEKDLSILIEQLRPFDRWKLLAEELGFKDIIVALAKKEDPPVALIRYLKGIDWKVKVLAEALAKILVKDEEPSE